MKCEVPFKVIAFCILYTKMEFTAVSLKQIWYYSLLLAIVKELFFASVLLYIVLGFWSYDV